MKKVMSIFIIAAAVFSSAFASALEFSADMIMKGKGGDFQGKIYTADKKVRTEMTGAISIVRMDQNVAFVIMPDQKMYMEQPIDPKMMSGSSEKMPGEIERTPLGDDTINGRSAAKCRIVYEDNGVRQSILQWTDKASSVPVKVTAEDGSWSMEYNNLNVGPQDPSLFEVPQGYAKFSMPNMQGMMEYDE